MNNLGSVGAYLKRIAGTYNKESSMTQIFENFRCIPKEYQEFVDAENKPFTYSSYDYSMLNDSERADFEREELSSVDTLICNSIYDKVGVVKPWKVIYNLARADGYKDIEKKNRKVIYGTSTDQRPIGEGAYASWNGLQVIDLDIKDRYISEELHKHISEELCKFNWFLGVCFSASGKGLHVWTKIQPISVTNEQKKIEFLCNFRHKYSYLYIILKKYSSILNYTNDDIFRYLDMATAKVQQGLFVGYDPTVFVNSNFRNLRLDVNFEPAFNNGIESINWIFNEELKDIFAKLEWFNNDSFDNNNNIEIGDIDVSEGRDGAKHAPKHYKHSLRWQLANTLTNIYGYDKAVAYMLEICKDTPEKELRADVKTASIHNKPISIWAINELNKSHGFKIKVNKDIYAEERADIEINDTDIMNNDVSRSANLIKLYINKDQYLTDIKDDIISNLGKITLLEAGAGYGKTEMIKALKTRTLLILPFTSTIKSKIEKSEVTSNWLYYYGTKRPSLEDILGEKSMSMTIDKFSRLNIMELAMANFEYIVFDESHLLFTSSYREVMSPAIQRLANCKSKVIMMTGTPTGEMTFFPGIKHIKVTKEDLRVKDFELNFCASPIEQKLEMCKSMAKDIAAGKKILYPTNLGNTHYEIITGLIQQELNKLHFGRPLNKFYYKKSNYGDANMDGINYNKSVGSNDIIFCTTYLSVGVDICDVGDFCVYFDEIWISQDIEQFANRLRKNDLYIKMFLPNKGADGNFIDYYKMKPLDLSFSNEDVIFIRDVLHFLNDWIINREESAYNPILADIITIGKFAKYDENDRKYYIDETAYKLYTFEKRYSEYAKQLKILSRDIAKFGYTVSTVNHPDEVDSAQEEALQSYIKSCRHARYNYTTDHTMRLLDHFNENNIDLYREIHKGNYDIIKSNDDKYSNIRKDSNIYTEDIEILEKNIPIIFSFYKNYEIPTIKDIYEYCTDHKNNRINFTKLNRIRRFVNIVANIKKHRLDLPVYKVIQDFKKFAISNPEVTKEELTNFIVNETVKYANSIPGLVVEDTLFLESLYSIISEIWKVVIVQNNSKGGLIKIKPFELLWETKNSINNNYGSSLIADQFFASELIDTIKDEPVSDGMVIDTNIELPELEHTVKVKLESIVAELPSVVHADYDYYKYSQDDHSNDRFLAKQERTSSLRDNVFSSIDDTSYVDTETDGCATDMSLF